MIYRHCDTTCKKIVPSAIAPRQTVYTNMYHIWRISTHTICTIYCHVSRFFPVSMIILSHGILSVQVHRAKQTVVHRTRTTTRFRLGCVIHNNIIRRGDWCCSSRAVLYVCRLSFGTMYDVYCCCAQQTIMAGKCDVPIAKLLRCIV